MVSFPVCKINLGLNILRKRSDGYHDIETCFYPVPWTDILECIPSKEFSFTSSGLTIPGDAGENLCVKAFQLLKKDLGLDEVSIHLHKIIPAGAGLGGGSSDAAYTLRLLNTVFELNLPQEKLRRYAAMIGSDCAFFIQDLPMMGTGRGDVLHPVAVNLRGKRLALVIPPVHVSTAGAYAGVKPKEPEVAIQQIVEQMPPARWKENLVNDFEQPVTNKYPETGRIKDTLYAMGAIYASMSGSGSSVFGIFDGEQQIDMTKFKGYTFWSGILSV